MRKYLVLSLLLSFLLITSCTHSPPHHALDVCKIFKEYPKWYWSAQKSKKKWGVPIDVQMAIIYTESGYHANAKPPRRKLLGFIPWFRPTSAKGYTQAVNSTWKKYLDENGKYLGSRGSFSNATDFVGWYAHRAYKKIGINRTNAYQVYLAYHEGIGGYTRRTYLKKPWLIHLARRVQQHAKNYQTQLWRCRKKLPSKPWWRVW